MHCSITCIWFSLNLFWDTVEACCQDCRQKLCFGATYNVTSHFHPLNITLWNVSILNRVYICCYYTPLHTTISTICNTTLLPVDPTSNKPDQVYLMFMSVHRCLHISHKQVDVVSKCYLLLLIMQTAKFYEVNSRFIRANIYHTVWENLWCWITSLL